MDEILDTDITIILLREKRPAKLLKQLSEKYHVISKLFPMQVVVTGEFGENSHIWLKALTRSMDIKQAEELLDHYERIQDEEYHAKAGVVVNLVSDVNSALQR